ncbi:MAG TPA: SH3 domain-containing protein [Candidatus Acidoferrales bacterium]|nr:SH3 domain-containing protein [Candidatus Acidoferrales bacterium]
MRRIIGVVGAVIGCLLIVGCSGNGGLDRLASSARRASPSPLQPSPSPSGLPAAVWVLSPLGLNLRASPNPQGQVLTTLSQGAELNVLDLVAATDAGAGWLHVRFADSGTEGYVSDDPALLIDEAVSQHVESTSGYSNLFPSSWSLVSGNPAVMSAPPSDQSQASLSIQTATTTAQLPKAPAAAATELRQESPILIYGKTTYLTVYKLHSGAYEFVASAQFATLAALFDFHQSASAGSGTGLFKTLLSSVIIPGG